MARRTVLLVIALVVALLGTTAVFAYVRNVDDRAIADAEPVEVLVAKERINAGTTGQDASQKGLLTLLTVPRKAVPDGALSDIGAVSTQVALSDIYPGEMLLRPKFGVQQTTGALTIPAGKLAMSVQLGDPQRVAGFVEPGSEVAIFVTYDILQVPGAKAAGGLPQATEGTRLLLPRIPVIAVGPTSLRPVTQGDDAAKANVEPVATAVLTVAVTQAQAEQLIFAAEGSKLYFGLLSKESVTGPGRGVDNNTLFGP